MPKLGFASGGLIPDDQYKMVVASCVADIVPSSGNLRFKFRHEVLDGEYENKPCWDDVIVSPKGMFYVQKAFSAITGDPWGEDIDVDDLLEWGQEQADNFTGMTFSAIISSEPYTDKNGVDKMKNTIAEYLPKDFETPEPKEEPF